MRLRLEKASEIADYVDIYCNLDSVDDYEEFIEGIAIMLDQVYNEGYQEAMKDKGDRNEA